MKNKDITYFFHYDKGICILSHKKCDLFSINAFKQVLRISTGPKLTTTQFFKKTDEMLQYHYLIGKALFLGEEEENED